MRDAARAFANFIDNDVEILLPHLFYVRVAEVSMYCRVILDRCRDDVFGSE